MRDKIIEMGGEYRFETCLTNIIFNDNKIEEIEVNHNEKIKADILVLAIGHSARDTFKMLFDKKINMTTKPFAVGVRVQHSQKMINKSQYGTSENEYLKEASYKLTHTTKDGRGVYTFCMCPGGFVVKASRENECPAVNGMSNYKRDSGNANSAVIVTVSDKDFGNNPMDGIEFQRKLERNAYMLGNGKIPVSLLEDYLKNSVSKDFGSIKPVMKGEYVFADLNKIFPDYINDSIKEGIIAMDSKIKGFASPDTILAGVESRTSSPVKIVRDEAGESNIKGLYPSGEGAGYAGGHTSAAIDGLVTFEKIISTYKNS